MRKHALSCNTEKIKGNLHQYANVQQRIQATGNVLDKEFDAMQRDLAHLNRTVQSEQLTGDFSGLGLFFKSTRIQILYGSGRSYVRIKLRTLLKQYGYKRRSSSLLQYIRGCMLFYNLEVALRNGIPCSIETVGLDRMLTFRLSSRISSS